MFLRTGMPAQNSPGRRRKIALTALSVLILLIGSIFTAAPAMAADAMELEWEKLLGTRLLDRGLFAIQTGDGGYIVVGETMSEGAYFHGNGGLDVYLAKVDASGYFSWHKTFGGVRDDLGAMVQQTGDGGYIITGTIQTFSANANKKLYLVKTGSDGSLEWEKTFGGSGEDAGACVRQTADGGYIITGETSSSGAGQADVYLVKTDANGKLEWEKTFGGKDDDYGTCVRQTVDGGFIVAGRTSAKSRGGYDAYLIKTDASGKTQWEKTFGGPGWDIPYTLEQTSDGGYIMAGRSSSFGQGDFDVYMVKTDAQGNKQLEQTHGGSGWDTAKTVRQTEDGGYLVAGWTSSTSNAQFAFLLLQTDANGNKLWQKSLTGEKYDEQFSVQEAGDGYIIAGWWNERLKNQQWRNDDMQVYLARVKVQQDQAVAEQKPRGSVGDVLISDSPLTLDAPLIMKNNRILVPYRAIAEALGAEVDWDPADQIVTMKAGENTVKLKIGSATALVSGEPVEMDVKAEIQNGRTYVPLRFISTFLGAGVEWDSETRTVTINK